MTTKPIRTALRDAMSIPHRVRDLETRVDLADHAMEYCADDLVKIEEAHDALVERLARIEAMLGIMIEKRETET